MLQSVSSSKKRIVRNRILILQSVQYQDQDRQEEDTYAQVQSYQDKDSQEFSTKARKCRSSKTMIVKIIILVVQSIDVARQRSSRI